MTVHEYNGKYIIKHQDSIKYAETTWLVIGCDGIFRFHEYNTSKYQLYD